MAGFDGLGAPFYRVFFGDVELSAQITSFRYEYFEEGDDTCTLEIKSDDGAEPDNPQWQKRAELKLLWGFLAGGGNDMVVSPVRKTYVQESSWKYSESGVVGVIECTDKAVSLKYEDTQEIFQNTSLPEIVKKMADRTSLKSFLELTQGEVSKFPRILASTKPGVFKDEKLSTWDLANRQALMEQIASEEVYEFSQPPWKKKVPLADPGESQIKAKPQETYRLVPVTPEQYDAYQKAKDPKYVPLRLGTMDRNGNFSPLPGVPLPRFLKLPNVPGSNKSLRHIIDEVARREPDGPWFLDTRDDEVIIKKRNFMQPPYRSYTYQGGAGDLYEYSPMSRQRRYGSRARGVSRTNWDAAQKIVFKASSHAEFSDEPTVSAELDAYHYFLNLEGHGLGNKMVDPMYIPVEFGLNNTKRWDLPGIINPAEQDNTTVNKPHLRQELVPHSVSDWVLYLRDRLTEAYKGRIENNNYDPISADLDDARASAENERRAAELKNNPAKAKVWGDPQLTTGILITILGVGKRFSGNHYITKAEHTIDSNGYLVDLEMATQGNNLKTKDSIRAKGRVNWSIGPSVPDNTSKSVPIKTNPQ